MHAVRCARVPFYAEADTGPFCRPRRWRVCAKTPEPRRTASDGAHGFGKAFPPLPSTPFILLSFVGVALRCAGRRPAKPSRGGKRKTRPALKRRWAWHPSKGQSRAQQIRVPKGWEPCARAGEVGRSPGFAARTRGFDRAKDAAEMYRSAPCESGYVGTTVLPDVAGCVRVRAPPGRPFSAIGDRTTGKPRVDSGMDLWRRGKTRIWISGPRVRSPPARPSSGEPETSHPGRVQVLPLDAAQPPT